MLGIKKKTLIVNFKECKKIKSKQCQEIIRGSEKAKIQRSLEIDFLEFEQNFRNN